MSDAAPVPMPEIVVSDRFDYGLLPPRLFEQVVSRIAALWRRGQVGTTPRD